MSESTPRSTLLARTLAAGLEHARELAQAEIADRTREEYLRDWRRLVLWLRALELAEVEASKVDAPIGEDALAAVETALTPIENKLVDPWRLPIDETSMLAWVGDQAARGLATSTIRRRVQAVAWVHRSHGYHSPTDSTELRRVMRGLARTRAGEPSRAKRPLNASMIASAAEHLSERDLAIVVVALVTGLRASDLERLTWGDIERAKNGRVAAIRKSKNDQKGLGRVVAIPRAPGPLCPVRALVALRKKRRYPKPGERIFDCSKRTISRVIKKVAKLAGEPKSEFASHSARAGMMTTAAEARVTLPQIMLQSGHASPQVAMGYVRPVEMGRNEAALAVAGELSLAGELTRE